MEHISYFGGWWPRYSTERGNRKFIQREAKTGRKGGCKPIFERRRRW